MDYAIEVRNLNKHFAALHAVRDISFNVSRGEVLGFLGPNGAGKSTTMKMIAGFLEPSSGSAAVCGFDVSEQPLEVKQRIGYLPEGAPSYGEMTTLAFLRFIAEVRGVPAHLREARIREALRLIHLESVVDQRVETLSKGFKRRVGLAQAILHDPEVLILDEPTNDLDAETLELLEELLIDYPGTILLISHDRTFLNNVVTSTLVFEAEGVLKEYVGGYDDWLRMRKTPEPVKEKKTDKPAPVEVSENIKTKPKKLGYKQQRELESLPGLIESLEAEQSDLHQKLADPAFYQAPENDIAVVKQRLDELEDELGQAYQRWEELESLE